MVGKKIGVLIALFMVILVVTMPVVFAKSISSYSVMGSDGIEDVISADNDYIFVEVEVSLDENETIEEDELYFEYSKTESFDSCTDDYCYYQSTQADRTPQIMDWTISLLEGSTTLSSKTGTLTIDGEAPEIDDFEVEIEGEDITIEYEIIDTACDECTGCAGIETVTFYEDDTVIREEEAMGECGIEDEIETTISELNLQDGDHELCIEAEDKVGFTSDQVCQAVSVDVTGPHFETGTFRIIEIYNDEEIDMEYIGDDHINAYVYINVSDDNLDASKVYADISAINTEYQETGMYTNVSGSCTEIEEDYYECVWSGYLAYGIDGSISMDFSAYDQNENVGEYTASFTVTKDEEPPTVVDVYKQEVTERGDLAIMEGENTVKAQIDPTGSAFEKGEAYMTFSMAGVNNQQADACEDIGDKWECTWNFTVSGTYSGSDTYLMITTDTQDDAGNRLETAYTTDIYLDTEPPEITGIDVTPDCPTAYEVQFVYVNVSNEEEEVYVEIEAEEIFSGSMTIEGDCEQIDEEDHECIVELDDFVTYSEEEDVIVRVTDSAGNIMEEEYEIEVCELEEVLEPDFITLSVIDYPDVDKRILSYMDYPLHIELRHSVGGSARILEKTAECTNSDYNYFIDIDDGQRSTVLVVEIDQQTLDDTVDELVIECQLQFSVQRGNTIYAIAEEEEFEIAVDLYGLPLGSYEDAIEERIALQQIGIEEAEKKINDLVAVNQVFNTICTIIETIVGINSIFGAVKGIILGIAAALDKADKIPPLKAPAEAMKAVYNIVCNGFGIFNAIIQKGIWPPGFGTSLGATEGGAGVTGTAAARGAGGGGIGTGINWPFFKYACMLHSGKLCEGFGWASFGVKKQTEEGERWLVESDPFRSIHSARMCLYLTGYIYGLRKERQINCMYKTCIEDNAKVGLPVEVCDDQFRVRQCLYVDGAGWARLLGGNEADAVFKQMGRWALGSIDWLITSVAYEITGCPQRYNEAFERGEAQDSCASIDTYLAENFFFVLCNIMAASLSTSETGLFEAHGEKWDAKAELEGTDYCATTG